MSASTPSTPQPTAPAHAAATPLRLNASHFAFMRALVQGVPLRESWSRYLHPGDDALHDVVRMRATVQSIRDAFAAAARRERRHGIARLVLVDLSRLPDDEAQALPSLEVFAAERGLEDFSEAEQIEAYQAAHGRSAQRVGRRARLVARQLEALRWLESLSTRPPQLDDPVDAWLDPLVAGRLIAAGLGSVRQLVEHRQGRAGRWWRRVRAVGAVKAARVERWLADNAAALGLEGVDAPTPDNNGSSPSGSFDIASAHGGDQIRFQRPQTDTPQQPATPDQQALDAWLASKAGASPHTRRAYQREAERFLLWAARARGVALHAVTAADAQAYLRFAADPQPRADWCAPRHHPRGSPLWRPFEGPLSAAARRQTVTILRNLYAFLEAQGHRAGNPWHGAAAGVVRPPPIDSGRSLAADTCARIERRLRLMPDTAATTRLRLAWALMHGAGLRLSEVVAARLGDLRGELPPKPHRALQPATTATPTPAISLWLHIPGRGQRDRELHLPPSLAHAIAQSLPARGLLPDPLHPAQADAHLLGQSADFGTLAPGLAAGRPLDPRQGIAAATLADQFKRLFRRCADDALAEGDEADAQALRRASSHWLRHTHGLQAAARGVPLATAQGRMGHASPGTTALYRRAVVAAAPRQNRPPVA